MLVHRLLNIRHSLVDFEESIIGVRKKDLSSFAQPKVQHACRGVRAKADQALQKAPCIHEKSSKGLLQQHSKHL